MLIEQTQAIQTFSLPFAALPIVGQIPIGNNSVPMVAGKPTLLRLYIDAEFSTTSTPTPISISGSLHFQSPAGPIMLTAFTGPITALPFIQTERLNLQHTLNFMVPREYCSGTLLYTARTTNTATGEQYTQRAFKTTFHPVPPLKIHCVLVHYTGLDFDGNPVDKTPGLGDVLASLNMVLSAYPISDFSFEGCERLEWNKRMSVDSNWQLLLDTIAAMRAASNSNAVYLGFVPEAANCSGVCGKGGIGSGVCIFRSGSGLDPINDIVHELGHAIGRIHAPECLPPGETGDLNYPQYPFLSRASIGEVGIDLNTLEVKDPVVYRDYMSYCSKWTSPYGHRFAFNVFTSGSFSDQPVPFSAQRLFDHSHVALSWHKLERAIKLKSAFHIAGETPKQSLLKVSNICAHIFDADNALLHQVFATVYDDRDAGGFVEHLQLTFPHTADMHRMLLTENNDKVAEILFAPSPPQVEITDIRAKSKGNNDFARVQWKGSADKNLLPPLQYIVRYSADGLCWQTLLANTTDTEMTFALDTLPGGPACRVQIIASAGLRTSVAESDPFDVAKKPRILYVYSPASGSSFTVGSPVLCAATAFSPDFSNAKGDEIIWTSLRHGFLGTGQQLVITTLPPGTHWLQVHIPDGVGTLLTQQIVVHIEACPCAPPHTVAGIDVTGMNYKIDSEE